jgi:osmotically-inducible protein OsmY
MQSAEDGALRKDVHPAMRSPSRTMRSSSRAIHAAAALRAASAALAMLGLGGCALLHRGEKETPQQAAARVSDDARIRAEVQARIAGEPSLSGARIRVEVNAGEVAFFGSVPGMGALRCAETNAELVEGVHLVIDHMELTPGPPTVQCLSPRVFRPRA